MKVHVYLWRGEKYAPLDIERPDHLPHGTPLTIEEKEDILDQIAHRLDGKPFWYRLGRWLTDPPKVVDITEAIEWSS